MGYSNDNSLSPQEDMAYIESPHGDIAEYVHVKRQDQQITVFIAEDKRNLRAVQHYVGRLCTTSQAVNVQLTTLDVINAQNREQQDEEADDLFGLTPTQKKIITYIRKAKEFNASDVHITVGRDGADLTYVEIRIFGELEVIGVLKRDEGLELLGTAYASMSDVIKGTEFNPKIPQDARLAEQYLKLANLYGARYSHYPCVGGLYAVLRLINDDAQHIPDFATLGYLPSQEALLQKMLQRPEGLIILSGPTGSGKSTTLRSASEAYFALYGMNQHGMPHKRLFTIESPPEGRIAGAIQTAVRDDHDGWVTAIKSVLRLDPDAILNGEIRDHSSALAAIKAAMTGHLMLTTLHANDAINVIERLEMEGINRRLLADPQLFIGLISQRLVQKLCPHCRRPYAEVCSALTEAQRDLITTYCEPEHVYLRNYSGCEHCHRGVSGRTVIAEVIAPDARFFQLYLTRGRLEAKTYWHKELGGITRNQHALHLINCGLVDPLAAHLISPLDEDRYALLEEITP